jgi:AMP deaminase
LLADGINHGLVLNSSPVLKYLYYLKQIGISMSPISNNKLVCKYADSPFRSYFYQGLNVTLSTDDPLLLHLTDEPLIEEYAIAS